jgi:hypothetical protein
MPHRTVDMNVRRAAAYVSLPGFVRTGRARWNLEAPIKAQGYYITVGKTTKPYGRSVHNSAYLTHKLKGVLLIWWRGRLVGSVAIWRCYQRSWKFELLDRQPDDYICQYCLVENNLERPIKK